MRSIMMEPILMEPILATTSNPTASFPVGDWQFWVVTLVFLLAIAWLCWNVLPLRQIFGKGRSAPKRTVLTVEGERPDSRAKDH